MSSVNHSHLGAERCLLLEENRFAQAAIEQLAKGDNSLNPQLVFLSGPAGCGKSLIARWYVRQELSANSDVSIVHVTAAEFAAEFAEASEAKVISKFQERYRSLEVLVVEDLRSLIGRNETIQQLGFTLDHILAHDGRVLLTSRLPPGQLVGMPSRLISRLHAGVCATIELPDYAGRVSLLQHFAQLHEISIPYESICLLARELPVSPRELLSALTQLNYSVRGGKSPLDADVVARYLEAEIKPAAPSLIEITRAVARHFSTTTRSLRSHSRQQSLILPRQCAIYLSRTMTGLPLVRIADYFGKRHHSTVSHACDRVELLMKEQPEIRRHLNEISNALGSG